jgi:hypothetical protein
MPSNPNSYGILPSCLDFIESILEPIVVFTSYCSANFLWNEEAGKSEPQTPLLQRSVMSVYAYYYSISDSTLYVRIRDKYFMCAY